MSRKLEALKTDVLVVGSGSAGITAAIAAARNGARTTLVEYHGFLGGISTTLPWLGFHDRDYRQVVKGLAHEFVTRLQKRHACSPYVLDIKCSSLVSMNGHHWKILAMELAEEAGVQVMLHTHMVDTLREGDRITGIVVEHKTGRQEIHARTVIDCSGDGDVAARGGAAWEKGRTGDGLVQSPTLVFRLTGLDRLRFIAGCREHRHREWVEPYPDLKAKLHRNMEEDGIFVLGGFAELIERARQAGDHDLPQTRLVGVKTYRPDELVVVSTRVLGLDPTDVHSVSTAYARLFAQVRPLERFFQKYVPGCENAVLEEIVPLLGIRESRRIMGDYVMQAEDMVEGRIFEDAVAMGGYHIDIHRPKGTWVDSRNVQAYTIPIRSLIARDLEGLMMAGKCLSATHEAVAGTRVIPICMAQGQAVGTLAALAAVSNKELREVPVSRLQDLLVEQGAEIGRTLSGPDEAAIERYGQLPMDEPPTSGDQDVVSAGVAAWVK